MFLIFAAESSSGSEFYDSEFDDDEELTGGSEKKRDSKEVLKTISLERISQRLV